MAMQTPTPSLSTGPVSYSRINTWLLCPKLYQYRYVQELEGERISGNLVFGTAIHEALELYMNSLGKEPLTLDETIGIFERALIDDTELANASSTPVDWGKKSLDEMVEKGGQMLAVFMDQVDTSVKVVGTEIPFEVTLDNGVVLRGFMDLVLELADGRYLVVDFKTSATALGLEKLEYDHQPTTYILAAEIMFDAVGKIDFEFWALIKTKKPQFRIYPVQRSQAQRDELIEAICDVGAAEAAGIFPRCRGFMCSGCEFHHRCSK